MLPTNARSEFLSRASTKGARNFSDGFVVEISRMFQFATPASNQPGLRPTRGSGLGAVTDIIADGSDEGSLSEDDEGAVAHPAVANSATSESAVRRVALDRALGWCVERSNDMVGRVGV